MNGYQLSLTFVAENLKKHLSHLSKRGPHRVLAGDLNIAGLPGKVYAPAEGKALPAVAFGHDWMQHVDQYHKTLRHLASWGIVVAAPDTETGPVPHHNGLAADLESTLQALSSVRLGTGNITVSPRKLGIAGHGMGAGAAILAASQLQHDDVRPVKAVAAVYPATTTPSAEAAARDVEVPGLILSPGDDSLISKGNPYRIAENWGGDVAFRELTKGRPDGFTESFLKKFFIGLGLPQTGVQETIRGLLTGFFLHQLEGQRKYSGFSAFEANGKGLRVYDADRLRRKADNRYEEFTA